MVTGAEQGEPDTDIHQAYRQERGRDIRNQQAMQRDGLPEEQAAASDDASLITGQVINCSGEHSEVVH